MTPETIPVVILAAGASERLKSGKQLLTLNGIPLVQIAARTALESSCGPVYVVLGARARKVARRLTGLPVVMTLNPLWEAGLSTSVRRGVRAVREGIPNARGVLLMTTDQPLVASSHLDGLLEAWRETLPPAVASSYAGTIGVPALFDRRLFEELEALEGDRGAKEVLMAHRSSIVEIPSPEAAHDVDDPGDLTEIERMLANGGTA